MQVALIITVMILVMVTSYQSAQLKDLEEKILVQGIIDLYYINQQDELILVDFKTDYVEKPLSFRKHQAEDCRCPSAWFGR